MDPVIFRFSIHLLFSPTTAHDHHRRRETDEDRHHSLQLLHFKLNIDDRQYNGCVVAVQCLRSFCASKVEDLVEVVDSAHEDSCFPSSSSVT
ncbi:hypothetical protein D8674_003980 [Pyrus ussuriensis x Pyrus communis]|uniref:Uncharacterized protein n=1 Tax=Pyrus ussuriensis x Pyrus communis TaxID=2448454 RepID=A0A5N5FIL1_9ROSA|nr:hypothetical protein D8674_003980 [Pyrus ussuriensis x Pyrus communis]